MVEAGRKESENATVESFIVWWIDEDGDCYSGSHFEDLSIALDHFWDRVHSCLCRTIDGTNSTSYLKEREWQYD